MRRRPRRPPHEKVTPQRRHPADPRAPALRRLPEGSGAAPGERHADLGRGGEVRHHQGRFCLGAGLQPSGGDPGRLGPEPCVGRAPRRGARPERPDAGPGGGAPGGPRLPVGP
ncbi:MAG: hypothetical protein B7X11_01605 [Acidobacteria bacterium 37-65-4]|nr:MAG: hypothetical protein B7X11_01605 [Acidobacteria bacterium 37-65-4]